MNFESEESEMRMFSEDETNHLFSSHNSLENNQVRDINEFMSTDSGTSIVSLIIEFYIIVFVVLHHLIHNSTYVYSGLKCM